jgi:predicted ATP-grasp superfamily ATP-dependent carboligase
LAARGPAKLAPVLLTTGGYYGTLAAVRALGRAGVPVVVADSDPMAVSSWSRFTHARMRAPAVREKHDGFLEWLLDFGKNAMVRHVLLPTCDDTAWLYARHREALAQYFYLSSCGVDAVYALLNKKRLADVCRELGIDTPETRSLASEADLARVAQEAKFPVLIKPATQVLFESRDKGKVITERAAFIAEYRRFRAAAHSASLRAFDASVGWPLVQEYFPNTETNIYNLSGYVGRNAEVCVFRASVKVLQERDIGVGICFEKAEVNGAATEAVRALFQRIGYHGIFEIEFIPAHGRYHLIDINPRFYGEMAFDVARGMSLPLIAYFDVLGDSEAVRVLIDQAAQQTDAPQAHTHRLGFEMFLRTQRFSGALKGRQQRTWREWREWHAAHAAHAEQLSDAVFDSEDWMPSVIDTAKSIYRQLRFPAELFEQMARYRLGRLR